MAMWVAQLLEAHDFPYAIGGAIALAEHGYSRATHDVDVNVFIDEDRVDALVTLLKVEGFKVPDNAKKIFADEGCIFTWKSGIRVDFFTPSIELSRDAERTRVKLPFGNSSHWFLSAEALCLFKLMFFRGKDLGDLEQLLRGNFQIDRAMVRRKLVDTMGEDDPRVAAWDKLVVESTPA